MFRIRVPLCTVCLLLACLLLSGCGSSAVRPDTDTGTAPPGTDASGASASGTDDLYEAVIAELRDELMREKAERYVEEAGYRQRIAELEQALTLSGIRPDQGAAQSVSGQPQADGDEPSVPASVSAPVDLRESGSTASAFRFAVSDGTVTVTAYVGTGGAVTVPAEIGGYPVTAIGESAFRDAPVTSVVLPDGVRQIGWFAFSGCPGLTSVTVPASVISIGYGAFENCPSVTVTASPGSYAAGWAGSYGLPVKAP